MEHGQDFVPLLIVLGLSFVVPLLINRWKALPVVVGEIFAGFLLAQLGILKPTDSPTLALFSNIGLAFLMFLAGLEIDLPSLFSASPGGSKKRRFPLPLLAILIYLLTLGLGAGGSLLLVEWGLPGASPELLTLMLGATSLGVLLPVLKNRGLLPTRAGQAVFLSATLADFLTVILLTIYILLREHGLGLEIFSLLLIFVLFIAAARLGLRFIRLPAAQKIFDELSQATVQIKVRGAIVIMLVFVVFAETLGIELILGAFLAGMLVALFKSPQDEGLVHKLEAFGFGMFIPVFFIMTGANLNAGALIENPQSLLFLPAMLGISILVKLIPALLLRFTMGWRATIASGFLLNTHLSLEVAIAVIGEQLGLLSTAASAAIILFSVVTVIFMPLLFNLLHPKSPAEPARRARLIYGWENNLARSVAQQLHQHGDPVQVAAFSAEHEAQIGAAGFEPLSQPELQMRPQEIETALVLGPDDQANLQFARQAQEKGIGHIVALVNEPAFLEQFKSLGVQVFSPAMYRATLVTLMARNPNTLDMLTSTSDERDLLEEEVRNPFLEGRRLRDLHLPGDALVLSIKRSGELLIPHGSTRLEMGDQVSILVNNQSVEAVSQWFQPAYGGGSA